jgi:hypothetical protein
MENDRWGWFAGGVVVGILIGLGVAAGFALPKYHAAREEAERARIEAQMQAERAREAEMNARREAERAERHAEEALQKLKKDNQAEKAP